MPIKYRDSDGVLHDYNETTDAWAVVDPGQLQDGEWLKAFVSIDLNGEEVGPARTMIKIIPFDEVMEKLRVVDRVKVWSIKKNIFWMRKVLRTFGMELVAIRLADSEVMEG